MTAAQEPRAALVEAVVDALHNLPEALYWADDGEGGEHFVDWPLVALADHVADAILAAGFTQTPERDDALLDERDMFREKAHNFIRLAGQYDEALGALTARLEALIETGERRAAMVVGVSELQAVLEATRAGERP